MLDKISETSKPAWEQQLLLIITYFLLTKPLLQLLYYNWSLLSFWPCQTGFSELVQHSAH